eukprot:7523407-Prorocentrum_lima.AAC.1
MSDVLALCPSISHPLHSAQLKGVSDHIPIALSWETAKPESTRWIYALPLDPGFVREDLPVDEFLTIDDWAYALNLLQPGMTLASFEAKSFHCVDAAPSSY